MSNRAATLMLLAGCCTVVGILAFSSADEPRLECSTVTAHRRDGATASQLRSSDAHRAAASHGAVRATVGDAAMPAPAARPLRSFTVVVVDAESRAPVAGAAVWYLSRTPAEVFSSPDIRRVFSELAADTMALCQRLGDRAKTDRDGRARVPLAGWGVQCVAAEGGRYGELDRPGATAGEEHLIELRRDVSARVRVVDVAGEPVIGVGVQLRRSADVLGATHGFDTTFGRTAAPDGILVLGHVQRSSRHWPMDRDGVKRTRIRLEILGDRSEGVVLDSERIPTQPVTMLMPATGRVVIDVRDPRGDPTADGYPVRLSVVGADGAPSDDVRTIGRRLAGGRVEFEHVILGQTLCATVEHGSARYEHTFAGPLRAGGRVVTEMRLAVADRFLTGRALDAVGTPVARVTVRATLTSLDLASTTTATGTTDALGRFRLTVQDGVAGEEWGAARFRIVRDGLPSTATLPVVGALHHGDYEVGDVQFRPAPLLVRGRVVDTSGVPIAGAEGHVQTFTANTTRIGSPWRSDSGLRFRTAADGLFAVHGEAPSQALRLCVSAAEHLRRDAIEFAPGAEQLEIELEAAGAVRATVLVGDDIPADALALRLVAEGSTPARTGEILDATTAQMIHALHRRRERVPSGWSYRWSDLAPGPYRVEARLSADAPSAACVESLMVRAREDGSVELDLRDRRE